MLEKSNPYIQIKILEENKQNENILEMAYGTDSRGRTDTWNNSNTSF